MPGLTPADWEVRSLFPGLPLLGKERMGNTDVPLRFFAQAVRRVLAAYQFGPSRPRRRSRRKSVAKLLICDGA